MEIKVCHISKRLGTTEVLHNIDMTMQGGKVYGLQGINGCGKTMLMRAVAGLIHPTQGEILIDGVKYSDKDEFPPSMGILIEHPSFLEGYTGKENLWLLAQIRGKCTIEDVEQAMQRVGLDSEDKRKYKKYSLGMKQRLGIACAIMEKPDLLILDEPLIALDKAGQEMVLQVIGEEKKRGALVLMSSHDGGILESVTDEIMELTAGELTKHWKRNAEGTMVETSICA